MSTPDSETPIKKTLWQSFLEAVQSPYTFLTKWSSKSPLLTVIAVVFLIQPIISTCVDVVKEIASVKHELDPANRPVTRAEFDLMNQKIDFLQQMIVANTDDIKNTKHQVSHTPLTVPVLTADANAVTKATAPIAAVQSKLDTLSRKLDNQYKTQSVTDSKVKK